VKRKKGTFNVDSTNGYGHTALMEAARVGNADIISELWKLDADPNMQTYRGWTALMYAAKSAGYVAVSHLVKMDPDADRVNDDKETALMIGVRRGNLRVIQQLIQLKYDPEVENIHGWTALMIASAGGNTRILQEFIDDDTDNSAIDHQSKRFETAICIAARARKWRVEATLLAAGAMVDIGSQMNEYPLHFAIEAPDFTTVSIIMQSGNWTKNPADLRTGTGETSLHLAVDSGRKAIYKLLIFYGANPALPDLLGETPQDRAKRKGAATQDITK
jgi:ankyrin repeat protein